MFGTLKFDLADQSLTNSNRSTEMFPPLKEHLFVRLYAIQIAVGVMPEYYTISTVSLHTSFLWTWNRSKRSIHGRKSDVELAKMGLHKSLLSNHRLNRSILVTHISWLVALPSKYKLLSQPERVLSSVFTRTRRARGVCYRRITRMTIADSS